MLSRVLKIIWLVSLAPCLLGGGGVEAGTLTHETREVIALSTGFGPLALTADRAHGVVEGRFGAAGEGRIVADLAGGMVRGVWMQPGGLHRCPTSRLGEGDWGTISFVWPEDGHFKARWGFCDGAETVVWEGTGAAPRGDIVGALTKTPAKQELGVSSTQPIDQLAVEPTLSGSSIGVRSR